MRPWHCHASQPSASSHTGHPSLDLTCAPPHPAWLQVCELCTCSARSPRGGSPPAVPSQAYSPTPCPGCVARALTHSPPPWIEPTTCACAPPRRMLSPGKVPNSLVRRRPPVAYDECCTASASSPRPARTTLLLPGLQPQHPPTTHGQWPKQHGYLANNIPYTSTVGPHLPCWQLHQHASETHKVFCGPTSQRPFPTWYRRCAAAWLAAAAPVRKQGTRGELQLP